MTTPTMALLEYLCKQGMRLDEDFIRAAVQVVMQALIDIAGSSMEKHFHNLHRLTRPYR